MRCVDKFVKAGLVQRLYRNNLSKGPIDEELCHKIEIYLLNYEMLAYWFDELDLEFPMRFQF